MAPCEVNFKVEGPENAPAVVFVNSLGTHLGVWEPQAAALRSGLKVIRFDGRGHGASPVPPGPYSLASLGEDLLALLDQLELERASICGVSIGGATALWVAAHAPERVDRVVVCFSATAFGSAADWDARAATVRAEGVGAIADGVLERWFTSAFARRDPKQLGRMREMLLATPAEGYAATAEAVGATDLGPELGAVRAPTLVLSGSEDPATPPSCGQEIAAAVAGASFVEVTGVAHLGHLERPAAVSELIVRHLSGGSVTRTEV